MSGWKDIEEFKESTFYLEANEDVNEFFKRAKERCDRFENVFTARIKQLFEEHIQIDKGLVDEELDDRKLEEATATILKVFAVGYQLGWNDQHEIKTT